MPMDEYELETFRKSRARQDEQAARLRELDAEVQALCQVEAARNEQLRLCWAEIKRLRAIIGDTTWEGEGLPAGSLLVEQ